MFIEFKYLVNVISGVQTYSPTPTPTSGPHPTLVKPMWVGSRKPGVGLLISLRGCLHQVPSSEPRVGCSLGVSRGPRALWVPVTYGDTVIFWRLSPPVYLLQL